MVTGWIAAVARVEAQEAFEARKKHVCPLDWQLAENLFLEGEKHPETGERYFPSMTAIADRIGVTKGAVSLRATRYGWREKKADIFLKNNETLPVQAEEREETVNTAEAISQPADIAPESSIQDRASEVPGEPLDPRARGKRAPLQILNDYIDLFDQQVKDGKVRYDAITDFDKAVRLRAFLLGEAETRHESRHVLSLDQLQARHREHRAIEVALTDEVTGVLAHGSTGDPNGASAPALPVGHAPAGRSRKRSRAAATGRKRQPTATAPASRRGNEAPPASGD